jgi:hypothetical protein
MALCKLGSEIVLELGTRTDCFRHKFSVKESGTVVGVIHP